MLIELISEQMPYWLPQPFWLERPLRKRLRSRPVRGVLFSCRLSGSFRRLPERLPGLKRSLRD
jgi:hypothetical protein